MFKDTRSAEVVRREILALVKLAKDTGAMRWVIMEFTLRVEYRWAERVLAVHRASLQEAEAMPDDGIPKDGSRHGKLAKIKQYRQLVEVWQGRERVYDHLLEFMKQLDAGIYPSDWHEKPAWSMDYHYEGMFRHHVGGRMPLNMQLLEKQYGAPLTDEQMKDEIVKNNYFLRKFMEEDASGK